MGTIQNTGKIIGWILVGSLLGAAAGILFAPQSGSKTRGKIVRGTKRATKDLRKKIKKGANTLISKAQELENMAEDKIHNLTNNVKQKAENTMKH